MTLNFLFLKLPSSFWTYDQPHASHWVVPWMNQMTFVQQVQSFSISPKCSFPTQLTHKTQKKRSPPHNWQHESLSPPHPPATEVLRSLLHGHLFVCHIASQTSLSHVSQHCYHSSPPALQQELLVGSTAMVFPACSFAPCSLFPDCQQNDCCSVLNPLGFLILHNRAAQWETINLKVSERVWEMV